MYRKATERLKSWLDDKPLTDGLLAAYITELHQSGKYSSTIAQVVVVVKWRIGQSHAEVVGEITHIMRKRSWRNGEQWLGSEKAKGENMIESIMKRGLKASDVVISLAFFFLLQNSLVLHLKMMMRLKVEFLQHSEVSYKHD